MAVTRKVTRDIGRRGRPQLLPGAESVNVHVRLPLPDYDATYQQASAARCTVPQYIRRVLKAARR